MRIFRGISLRELTSDLEIIFVHSKGGEKKKPRERIERTIELILKSAKEKESQQS